MSASELRRTLRGHSIRTIVDPDSFRSHVCLTSDVTIFAVRFSYLDRPSQLDAERPPRLAWFRQLEAGGSLLASGQLLGSAAMSGMLVLEADDRATAEQILDADPYALAGLVAERTIEQWRPTVGTWL